jgi:serine/threonine protein kinase
MGVVYRACDTNLGPDVTLKIPPEGFARDPDRLARFERESRLLASLDHPNIAQIGLRERGRSLPALIETLDRRKDVARKPS